MTFLLTASFSMLVSAQEAKDIEQMQIRPDTPRFEQDVSVTLQLVDIIARDSSGNYIKDLKRDEFRISVNGNQVQVRTFDAFFRGQRGGIEDLASGTIPDAIAPSRRLVLFFDQAYSSFRGLRQAKGAAIEFVKRNLSPGDQVMVVGYDRSFKIHQKFTRDRDELVDAIENIKFAMVAGNRAGVRFDMENTFNVRTYLQAMENLALFLKTYRGRKTLIMLSEGYNQLLVYSSYIRYQIDMLERFNDANTSIYPIDVRGLAVGQTGGGFSLTVQQRRQDTLSIFANETGGKFYRGSNDIEQLLLNLDDDVSNYYVLGFYTENAKDGNFRELRVSTTRPGVKLQHRKGFFANKPFSKMSGDEKTVSLEEGFYRTAPIKEFPVEFATYIFPRNDGSAVASIAVDAPLNVDGKQQLELLGYVFGPDEEMVDAFHKEFSFSSSSANNRFHHLQTTNLVSGENLIKMVLRDNSTGKRSYHFVNARMPLLGDGLHASTIAFVDDQGAKIDSAKTREKSFKRNYKDVPQREPANPLSPVTRAGIRVKASTEIARSDSVGVLIKISGIKVGSEEPRIKAQYSLRRKDGSKIELTETDHQVLSVRGTGEAIVHSTIDFSKVVPGDYVLTATLEDIASERLVGQRAEIRVR